MMWAGLALGIVVGAVLWNLPGAVILGFIGWLAGVIVDSKRAASSVRLDRGLDARARLQARRRDEDRRGGLAAFQADALKLRPLPRREGRWRAIALP